MWKLILFISSLIIAHASFAVTAFAETMLGETALVDPALSSYHIDPQAITISGVSSGAFMAVQMQVAFSKTFDGAASIAGGTFWCAKGDENVAQTSCMGQPAQIQTSESVAEAEKLAASNEIDPLANLAGKPMYVFASPKDSIINPGNSDKLVEFLMNYKTNVRVDNSLKSAHGWPTVDNGGMCGFAMPPWILKCGFDTAGETLTTLYGPLNAKGTADATHLIKFSQTDFGGASTPLFPSGWIYVPSSCAGGETCKLHVALHGCQMNPDYIQDQFARLSGFNEWAETNKIVILYPQSAKIAKSNPYACWDWFGFTGQNYVTRSGSQMSALKKMVERVRGN